MKKLVVLKIIFCFFIIIFFIQTNSIARYYEILDTINVRFTIEEKYNSEVN